MTASEDKPTAGKAGARALTARVYSALSPSGRDHFAADRETAAALEETIPGMRLIAQSNKHCLRRMLAYAVELADPAMPPQVLDIGAGLPDQPPALHEVAHRVRPDSRVVYVDHDLQVYVHGRALLRGDGVDMVQADLRKPSQLLAAVEETGLIDRSRPVIIVLGAVLHFLNDEQAEEALAELRDSHAAGSLLLVTHATSDVPYTRDQIEVARSLYEQKTGQELYLRTGRRIAALLLPWGPLHPPGLQPTEAWYPDYATEMVQPAPYFLAGVAGPR
ncbi:SAM-dependent methyltransferase [Nonomuraea ceibae]|uniref:SAM-dependent methyltransferase n=1 Tax=Nonomuraea ceibae TaxID=1935170 RepID=UPI001C5DA09C|nr:SAM-dependent methyltransferase [Nonomuraea ceibae]